MDNEANLSDDNSNQPSTYNTLNVIGSGGYGTVFKIEIPSTKQLYALKVCNIDGLTDKEKQSILNETQNLIKVRSEFVIQYYYSWIAGTDLCIQMELCFESLKKFLAHKRNLFKRNLGDPISSFELYMSYHAFGQLIECVKYMHDNNLIHRDLKPDNVLIAINDRGYSERYVKLCDFGVSKHVLDKCDPHKMSVVENTSDVAIGEYQAPEAMGNDYNYKIDIFSLAMIGADIFEFDKKCLKLGRYQSVMVNVRNIK
ncbi:unnamed protein product [Oppiella nova]|uniref:Protein kinase domain-containing protein n=1 Tax=Oppiella nova TaxID=334625 RepID=A0A7R9QVC8_9ACAR|nr:unnamed protein product [Oppiella nova]CAG2175756.1 unnamed protein product [Oppiella nova]